MVSTTKVASERYVVDREGQKKEVILPLAKYERLLEDLHDLAVVAERREETPVSVQAIKRRLETTWARMTLFSSLIRKGTWQPKPAFLLAHIEAFEVNVSYGRRQSN